MGRIVPKGEILKCCLMRVETQMPRTFKNQTQHSKESFNVWANSSGYQDKLYSLYDSQGFVLRDWEKNGLRKQWNVHSLHVMAVIFVPVCVREIRFLIHFYIYVRLTLADGF